MAIDVEKKVLELAEVIRKEIRRQGDDDEDPLFAPYVRAVIEECPYDLVIDGTVDVIAIAEAICAAQENTKDEP